MNLKEENKKEQANKNKKKKSRKKNTYIFNNGSFINIAVRSGGRNDRRNRKIQCRTNNLP